MPIRARHRSTGPIQNQGCENENVPSNVKSKPRKLGGILAALDDNEKQVNESSSNKLNQLSKMTKKNKLPAVQSPQAPDKNHGNRLPKDGESSHFVTTSPSTTIGTPPPSSVIIRRNIPDFSPTTECIPRSVTMDDDCESNEDDKGRICDDGMSAVSSLASRPSKMPVKKDQAKKVSSNEAAGYDYGSDDADVSLCESEDDDDDKTAKRSFILEGIDDYEEDSSAFQEEEEDACSSMCENASADEEQDEALSEEEDFESDDVSEELSDDSVPSDDDEYNPEDDESSSMEEELEVEEEVELNIKTRSRRLPKKTIPQKKEQPETEEKSEQPMEPSRETQEVQVTEPASPASFTLVGPDISQQDDQDTEYEETPIIKQPKSRKFQDPMSGNDEDQAIGLVESPQGQGRKLFPDNNTVYVESPNIQVAVVVDDDDDDDDDEEILVAAILDDDGNNSGCSVVDDNTNIQAENTDAAIYEENHVYSPNKDIADHEHEDSKSTTGVHDSRDGKTVSESEQNSMENKYDSQGPQNIVKIDATNDASEYKEQHEIVRKSDLNNGESQDYANNQEMAADESEDSMMVSERTDCSPTSVDEAHDGMTLPKSKQSLYSPAKPVKAPVVANQRSLQVSQKSTKSISTPETFKPRRSKYHRQEGIIKRGKWTLGARIGLGSFGVVHIGMNTQNGTLMAVKTFKMDEAAMSDIRAEIEMLRSLDHVNIVRYYGAQMDKRKIHIFQEWVPAGSVATLLTKFGPFSMDVVRSYLFQTLSGLTYLHDNNIMHRDIKGSNILVNDEGTVKLADFGASKKLANFQYDMMMSLTVRGTPYFMAPEVFEEKYGPKADIWGTGCVAIQMATGSPPWKEKGFTNPISLFNHIKSHKGPPPMKIPDNEEKLSEKEKQIRDLFGGLVQRCYRKDPFERPSAKEMMDDPFFKVVHHGSDDEQTQLRGMFSPGSETVCSAVASPSPLAKSTYTASPSPYRLSRSKSVVQWKTSFLSPPIPARNSNRESTSPMRSKIHSNSPTIDASEWPDWARDRLPVVLKQQESRSPIISRDSPISNLMGSLAISEDSETQDRPNPYRRSSRAIDPNDVANSTGVDLKGLKFLEASTLTYEI